MHTSMHSESSQGQFRCVSRCRDGFAALSCLYLCALSIRNYLDGRVYDAIATAAALPFLAISYYYSKQYGDIVAVSRSLAHHVRLLGDAITEESRDIERLRNLSKYHMRQTDVLALEDETKEQLETIWKQLDLIEEGLNEEI